MESIRNILNNYGTLIVETLRQKVRPLSATGKTEKSIRYAVDSDAASDELTVYARAFFATIETGRGPRRSTQQGDFLSEMLEYMQARGIGADLTDKKRRNLARFLVLRINRDGDETYQRGGRKVYSDDLDKLVDSLRVALKKDFVLSFRNNLKKAIGTLPA